MALGAALTNRFLLGDFEVRIAHEETSTLTAAHSVGVVDGFTLAFSPVQMDVLSGTSTLTQSYVTKQNAQIQFTFREFSWRNWQMALGGLGLIASESYRTYVPSIRKTMYPYRVWVDGRMAYAARSDFTGSAVLYDPYGTREVSVTVTGVNTATYDEFGNDGASTTAVDLSQPRSTLNIPDKDYYLYFGATLPDRDVELVPDRVISPSPRALPFQHLQLIQRDRETAEKYLVWDFPQVNLLGGLELSSDNQSFSSGTIKFKNYGNFTYTLTDTV